ncbi:hypothetical protein CN394_14340 [Bacillus anthracis]|nr:hypothetical protein CN394_14340 [Bacillus anthracis]
MIFRFLKMDIRRLVTKKSTWFVLILFLLAGYGNFMLIRSEEPTGNPDYVSMSGFEYFVSSQGGGSGLLLVILPLLVTLATGDSFIRERRSSILSYSLMRINIDSYIKNRMLSLAITSSVFMFFCQLLLLILALCYFPVTKPSINQGIVEYAANLFVNNPGIYCFIILINSACMAFFFSLFSIIISIIFQNLYAAVMLPYVLFIGISSILMSFPSIFGLDAIVFYNFAPMTMSGDYISKSIHWTIVPIYWVILSLFCFKIGVSMFVRKFQGEKLLLK